MKILYLDCHMGCAGDMLTAALLELLPEGDRAGFVARMNALGIPGVHMELVPAVKCGIRGSRVLVTVNGVDEEEHHHAHEHEHEHCHEHEHEHDHDHEHDGRCHHHHDEPGHCEAHPGCGHGHGHHHHHSLADISAIIGALEIPEGAKERAGAVYAAIAGAEGRVHGREAGEVHFHEVGAMDAVADVTAVSLLIELLAPEKIVVSPVRTGYGTVKCAHGVLPVPAPATALLLEGVPVFAGDIPGEMTTPTGAALLRSLADEFAEMPPMTMQAIGYGMGARDFPAANCVRAVLGEAAGAGSAERETAELFCTLDDATAEDIAYACELLMGAGALDVYTCAVGMKKGRPGTLISCLCAWERRGEFAQLLLKHTSTLGVRIYAPERVKLSRSAAEVETKYGPVRVKRAAGFGVEKAKPEYEDLARISRETGEPIAKLRREIERGL